MHGKEQWYPFGDQLHVVSVLHEIMWRFALLPMVKSKIFGRLSCSVVTYQLRDGAGYFHSGTGCLISFRVMIDFG